MNRLIEYEVLAGSPRDAYTVADFMGDLRQVLRGELQVLDRIAQQALPRAMDTMTRLHLQDVRAETPRILEYER